MSDDESEKRRGRYQEPDQAAGFVHIEKPGQDDAGRKQTDARARERPIAPGPERDIRASPGQAAFVLVARLAAALGRHGGAG